MRRRTLLAVGGGVALSGCLARFDRPSKRIAWIQVVNERPEPYDVAVTVERSDETAFTDEFLLGTDTASSTVRVDDPVEGRHSYTIAFGAGGQTDLVYPREYDDVSEPCVGIRYVLHDPDRHEDYDRGTRGFEVRPVSEC